MLELKTLKLGAIVYGPRCSKDPPSAIQLVTTHVDKDNHTFFVTSTEDDKVIAKQKPSGGRGEATDG